MSEELIKIAQEDVSEIVDLLVKVASEEGIEVTEEEVTAMVQEEVTAIEKSASIAGFMKNVDQASAGTLGKALTGASLGMGFIGANSLVQKMKQGSKRREFQRALDQAIKSNPILKQAPRDKIERFAETVFRFAPNVATDINLLSSILANAVHGESMDPQTVKSLTELEAKFNQYSVFKPKDLVV